MIKRKDAFKDQVLWLGGSYSSSDLLYYDLEIEIIESLGDDVIFKRFRYTVAGSEYHGLVFKAMIAVSEGTELFDDGSLVALPCPPFCGGKGELTNYGMIMKGAFYGKKKSMEAGKDK